MRCRHLPGRASNDLSLESNPAKSDYRNATRPDMAEGCRRTLSFEFFAWIWNYPKRSRPKVVKLLDSERAKEKAVRLRTSSEVDRFLDGAANREFN